MILVMVAMVEHSKSCAIGGVGTSVCSFYKEMVEILAIRNELVTPMVGHRLLVGWE